MKKKKKIAKKISSFPKIYRNPFAKIFPSPGLPCWPCIVGSAFRLSPISVVWTPHWMDGVYMDPVLPTAH